MKKRVFVFLNFVAFNLLFFALYLNFIHKDVIASPAIQQQMHSSIEASIHQNTQATANVKSSENISGEKAGVSKEEKSF